MVHIEAGRVSWGGGGVNIFFRGRNVHQVYLLGINFPITLEICYTRLSGMNCFV